MEKNKVSVIIPAYNKADYTVKAVDSVLNQTYENIECIVVDDGSTDDTYTKLHPIVIANKNIEYIYQQNNGVSAARNKGIMEATGEYIALLDCDDEYQKRKIELSVKQDKDFVFTCGYFIDGDSYLLNLYAPRQGNLLCHNYICNSSPVIKKKCFEKVGLFDTSLFVCADWDMWLRMEEHYELTYLNMPLTYYRI